MDANASVDRTGPTRRRKSLIAGLALGALLAMLGTAAVAGQGDLGGKLRTGNEVRVPAGETVASDLYASGGSVIVDGTVNGDLVATGGSVTVNGQVTGDVLAAGGNVLVAGPVGGDVRVAGGQVSISGQVAEDVLAAGGQVELTPQSTVGQDVIASAGQLVLNGTVTGSVTGYAANYQRDGTVGGSDEVVVNQAAPPQDQTPDAIADAIRHFVVVVLVGLLALWLLPRLTTRAAALVRERPLNALAWGIGALIAVIVLVIAIPVVVVLVAIVLGGLGFDTLAALEVFAGIVATIAVIVGYAFLAWIVADAIIGLGLARLVWSAAEAPAGARIDWGRALLMLVVGAAVVVILTSLPIVGPWLKLLVVLVGVGALVAAWRSRRPWSRPLPGEPVETMPV
jgi:hypothetical protein